MYEQSRMSEVLNEVIEELIKWISDSPELMKEIIEEKWEEFCIARKKREQYPFIIPAIIDALFKNSATIEEDIRKFLFDELEGSENEVLKKIIRIEERMLDCEFFNLDKLAKEALTNMCKIICKKLENAIRLVFMKYKETRETEERDFYDHLRALILPRLEIIQKVLELMDEENLDRLEYYIRLYRRFLYFVKILSRSIIDYYNEVPNVNMFPIFKFYPTWLKNLLDTLKIEEQLKVLYYIEQYLPSRVLFIIEEDFQIGDLGTLISLIEYTLHVIKNRVKESTWEDTCRKMTNVIIRMANKKINDDEGRKKLISILMERKLLKSVPYLFIKDIAKKIFVETASTLVKILREVGDSIEDMISYIGDFLFQIIIERHLAELIYVYILEKQGYAVAYNTYLVLLKIEDNDNSQLDFEEIKEIDLVIFKPKKSVEMIELSQSKDIHSYINEKLKGLEKVYPYIWDVLKTRGQTSKIPFQDFLISFKITNEKYDESTLCLIREELTYKLCEVESCIEKPVLIREDKREICFGEIREENSPVTSLSNFFNQTDTKK